MIDNADLPFGFKQPEDSPGFLLWQTTVVWQRLIKKALEPYKISHSQFVIMALLLWLDEHKKDTTQSVISTWSKLDKMTVSNSLKELSSKKLVCRSENQIDTRAKNVALTETGKMLVCQLVPRIEAIDAEFFTAVSKDDMECFMGVLTCVIK